jgi:hypothetical protein
MEQATSTNQNYTNWRFETQTNSADIANNRFASYAAPTPDKLQSLVTVVSHLGMFSCAMGAALFLLPAAISADCSYHNDTQNGYNSTQTYDCNIMSFLLHSSMAGIGTFLLGVFAYWIGHRLNSNTVQYHESQSLIEKNHALSCCAPRSDKLQASVKLAAPFTGTALFGVTATLLAWAAMIKIGCARHDNGEVSYNNTDIYDCNIAPLAKKSSIGGAVFLAPGAVMCLVAYLLYKLDGSVERNVRSFGEDGNPAFMDRQQRNGTDIETQGAIDSKLDGGKAYAVKYTELYLTKFFESYKEAYVLGRLSMGYNHQTASSWALAAAKSDAENCAEDEASKVRKEIDARGTSFESEPLSLESSIATDSSAMALGNLKQEFPNWYRHSVREAYVQKFNEKHKNEAIKNVDLIERLQKQAIMEANNDAIESIMAHLDNVTDGECDDDAASFDESRLDG